MKVGETVRRFIVTSGLMIGLTMIGLPAQAAEDLVPTEEAATTSTEVAPAASAVCTVSYAELEAAMDKALKAIPNVSAYGFPNLTSCRVSIGVRPNKLDEAIAKLNATAGLNAYRSGQAMPPSVPGAIVVEVEPSQVACPAIYPPMPCGWEFQQIVLSPGLASHGKGEILAVDEHGSLFRYGLAAGNKLSSPTYLGPGWSSIRVTAPGDWNSDGNADLIGIDKAGRMFLYPGNGKGDLGKAVQIGHGWASLTVIPAGDLNGDKIPDMLAIDNRTGVLLLYLGNGKGGFIPGHRQVGHGWLGMQLFAAGDMNADGKTDILGLKPDGRLYFYAGKGTGTFQPSQQVGHGWTGMTLAAGADLDGDGKADIVGRKTNGDLLFYRGKGIGTFNKPVTVASNW